MRQNQQTPHIKFVGNNKIKFKQLNKRQKTLENEMQKESKHKSTQRNGRTNNRVSAHFWIYWNFPSSILSLIESRLNVVALVRCVRCYFQEAFTSLFTLSAKRNFHRINFWVGKRLTRCCKIQSVICAILSTAKSTSLSRDWMKKNKQRTIKMVYFPPFDCQYACE